METNDAVSGTSSSRTTATTTATTTAWSASSAASRASSRATPTPCRRVGDRALHRRTPAREGDSSNCRRYLPAPGITPARTSAAQRHRRAPGRASTTRATRKRRSSRRRRCRPKPTAEELREACRALRGQRPAPRGLCATTARRPAANPYTTTRAPLRRCDAPAARRHPYGSSTPGSSSARLPLRARPDRPAHRPHADAGDRRIRQRHPARPPWPTPRAPRRPRRAGSDLVQLRGVRLHSTSPAGTGLVPGRRARWRRRALRADRASRPAAGPAVRPDDARAPPPPAAAEIPYEATPTSGAAAAAARAQAHRSTAPTTWRARSPLGERRSRWRSSTPRYSCATRRACSTGRLRGKLGPASWPRCSTAGAFVDLDGDGASGRRRAAFYSSDPAAPDAAFAARTLLPAAGQRRPLGQHDPRHLRRIRPARSPRRKTRSATHARRKQLPGAAGRGCHRPQPEPQRACATTRSAWSSPPP